MVMKSTLQALLWPLVLMLLWSCGARLGPATEGGAYLNLQGEVVNAYAAGLDRTVDAALQALHAMRMDGVDRRENAGEFILLATAPDGSPLILSVVEEGRNLSTVKVRSGVADYWDHEFSYQVHALIRERLTEEPAARPTVRPTLPAAVGAAKPRLRTARSSPDGARPTIQGQKLSTPPADVSIYFDKDSNFPRAGELEKLETTALRLAANPSWTAMLTGFADPDENNGRPRTVAESRMLAVKFYLAGKGVDTGRMVAEVRIAVEPQGGDGNRRVDIRFRAQ